MMSEYNDALLKISDALGQHPTLWSQDTFDKFEVGTCEIISEDEDGTEIIEQHDDPNRKVDMYTVYGHYPNDVEGGARGVDALFDLDTMEEAISIKAELEVLTLGGAK